ncbi:zinc-ribbon domain-containing protein [Treponema phagedenis]|uniref:dynamin family protein n=1 Tax=Treponema phagedenis TaxID=162 RepID=UPI00197FC5B4|nr:dynamin family protein [Treponema phagedenis]QSI00564.1 zinc-ribbon domain-containing protein [Treponema phagedenis]
MLEKLFSFFRKETKDLDSSKEKIAELLAEMDKSKKLSDETIKKIKTELVNTNKQLDAVTEQLSDKSFKVSFVANVINAKPEVNDAFQKYQRLLYNDYMKYANRNDSLAEEAQCLLALQKVENDLKFIPYDEALLNKTIVAVVGSFSSGKSSFINSFFASKKIVLPIAMDQATAISSYVMNGSELDITGFSYSGGRVQVPENIFKLFRYGKIEAFNLNIKKIIHHIVVKNSFVSNFNNLCFIDTPGFEAAHETESDYAAAASAVTNANAVLWCFNCDAGTFTDDELHELATIQEQNPDLKIYIVANKADLKPSDECEQILDTSYKLLIDKGIKFEGFGLYSAKNKFTEQDESLSYHKGIPLHEFLESCNVSNDHKARNMLKEIDQVFENYITADKNRITKHQNIIRTLTIFESSFTEINDTKDEQLQYYKTRADTRRYKKLKEIKDTTDDEAELFEAMDDLKKDFNVVIAKDTKDIKRATELCDSMKAAVMQVFGLRAADISEAETSQNKSTEAVSNKDATVKYCRRCGNEMSAEQKFCQKCGMEVL